jgi:hypothetical protein
LWAILSGEGSGLALLEPSEAFARTEVRCPRQCGSLLWSDGAYSYSLHLEPGRAWVASSPARSLWNPAAYLDWASAAASPARNQGAPLAVELATGCWEQSPEAGWTGAGSLDCFPARAAQAAASRLVLFLQRLPGAGVAEASARG